MLLRSTNLLRGNGMRKYFTATRNLTICSKHVLLIRPKGANVARNYLLHPSYFTLQSQVSWISNTSGNTLSEVMLEDETINVNDDVINLDTVNSPSVLSQTITGYILPWISRDSLNVNLAASYLEQLSALTGMPWWAVIVSTSFTLECFVSFPLNVLTQQKEATRAYYKPEMQKQFRQLRQEYEFNLARGLFTSREHMEQRFKATASRINQSFFREHNCNPNKDLIPAILKFIIFLSMTFGLREVLGFDVMGMRDGSDCANETFKDGGILWFKDLSVGDKTGRLGMLIAVCFLTKEGIRYLIKGSPKVRFERNMLWVSLVMLVYMFNISLIIPAALPFYWFTAASFSLTQKLLLLSPKVRKLVGIPVDKNFPSRPYLFLAKKAKTKLVEFPKQLSKMFGSIKKS